MNNCPTCTKPMTELSELTGMSLYDLLYWCHYCGTVTYAGSDKHHTSILGTLFVVAKKPSHADAMIALANELHS